MPLISLFGSVFGLLSLAILGTGGYLLWSWWSGEMVLAPDDTYRLVRQDWRLWTGLALTGWSFVGRWIVLGLAARPTEVPSHARRGAGRVLRGASGSSLYVEETGPADAPPIVLTHGWGLDSTIWAYARDALSSRFRVITWDLPGLGRSKPAGDGAISLTDFAADLRAILDFVGDRPAVLVGHSIGGMTIQTLARDHPDVFRGKVAGVVLLNTTHTNPLKTMILSGLFRALRWPVLEPLMRLTIWLQPLAWLCAWQSYLSGSAHLANRLGFGRYVTRSQLEHVTLLATRNPPGAQAKGNLAMFRWDATAALPAIAAPTLVVGGDLDIVTKLEASRAIADAIPRARLQEVSGVNHLGFLERADIYNAAVSAFADGVQRPQGDSVAGQVQQLKM